MAYNKTDWIDGSTPALEALNLNKIEDGIADNEIAITTKETDLGIPSLSGYVLSSTIAGVRTWIDPAASNATAWGDITGVVSDQIDLKFELDGKLSNVSDDLTPSLSANMNAGINNIDFQNTSGDVDTNIGMNGDDYTIENVAGTTTTAIRVGAGSIKLESTTVQMDTLVSTSLEKQIFCSSNGVIYAKDVPVPAWLESDTDINDYAMPTLGAWVQMTDLTITFPEDVAAGELLSFQGNFYIENDTNISGTIKIAPGINGAAPVEGGLGESKVIQAQFSSIISISLVTGLHGGFTAGDTLTIYIMRESQENSNFNPWVRGAQTPSEIIISESADGLVPVNAVWGTITGDINTQTDLITLAGSKEDYLNVPTVDGYVLSSTILGNRSWIPMAEAAGAPVWGTVIGALSDQTDLWTALQSKEPSLATPIADGYVLSSTIAGVRSWVPVTEHTELVWGGITGILSDQTDLQNEFDAVWVDVNTNTAKVGITGTQTTDIITNNAKVGITTTQANEIVINTAKVSYTDSVLVGQHTNEIANNTSAITLNTTHRNSTTNPHSTTAAQVGAPEGSWTWDGTTLAITIP